MGGVFTDEARPDVLIVDLLKPAQHSKTVSGCAYKIGTPFDSLVADLQVAGMTQNVFHSGHGVVDQLRKQKRKTFCLTYISLTE